MYRDNPQTQRQAQDQKTETNMKRNRYIQIQKTGGDTHRQADIKIKDINKHTTTEKYTGTRTGPDRYTEKHIGRHKYKHRNTKR
jgi:hypothetical protein